MEQKQLLYSIRHKCLPMHLVLPGTRQQLQNDDLLEHRMVKDDNGKEHPEPSEGHAKFSMPSEARPDHMGAFLAAVRGQGPPACNVDLGCSTMVAIKMAVESYRTGQAMIWDSEKEEIIQG